MNEAAFPVARGAVSGRLLVAGAPVANALMVLAKPGSDWQAQGRDYLFWTRTDATGGFTIPKVRSGSYSLYACASGFSGQMELGNVSVAAGVTNRLGLWWRYLEERGTADLNYTVGTSSPANDWYYAQSVMALDSGAYLTPKWNVNFSLASAPTGTAELVIDFAGAMTSTLNLKLNGTSIGSLAMVNDAGIYRSATRLSRYSQRRVTFSASLLRAGANTLSFQLNGRSNWSGTKPVSPASGVMYDAIRLEVGAAQPEALAVEPEAPTAAEVFEEWAAGALPAASDRSFGGDADGDGVANGFAFAYGASAGGGSAGLLHARVIDGDVGARADQGAYGNRGRRRTPLGAGGWRRGGAEGVFPRCPTARSLAARRGAPGLPGRAGRGRVGRMNLNIGKDWTEAEARQLHARLLAEAVKIAAAESLTVGRVQTLLGKVSGASVYFVGGLAAYSIEVKTRLLGVDPTHAAEVNAVSARVAQEMARGACKLFNADIGLATTGYAEADAARRIAEPTAWVAVAWGGAVRVAQVDGAGLEREAMQARVAAEALRLLAAWLEVRDTA